MIALITSLLVCIWIYSIRILSYLHIGSMIALKRYSAATENATEGIENKKLLYLIWQELKVFCHDKLRTHENICKLHFLVWEEKTLIPSMGLEMATYGR